MSRIKEKQVRGTVKANSAFANVCKCADLSAKAIVRAAQDFGKDTMDLAKEAINVRQAGAPVPVYLQNVI